MSSAAQAFIAFLKCEATQSDERARSLRATAAAIEANNLEGRKRKRKRDAASKPKKAHSAYTLFVHENYEVIKQSHIGDVTSKAMLALVAQKWAETPEGSKEIYRYRADQMKDQLANPATGHHTAASELEEVELPELPNADDGEGKKPAIGKKEAEKGIPVSI